LKLEFAFAGVVLFLLIGWLIATLIEHPIGSAGLQFMGALIGVLLASAILMLGEALKETK
jgi:uncharacterized protein YacL